MDSDVIIQAEGLHKKFCRSLRGGMFYGLKDVFSGLAGLPDECGTLRKNEFWAVQDVNFQVRRGEAFGIVGINGSGKSTLLRLLAGIFPPDKGKIAVRGRIGALIAVGAGFHPHMSGRENIFLNGTIMGMSRQEIGDKLEDIIRFADIGLFIDSPVASYSSGMRVRLGFSIAIHAPISILLADEILAVGDVFFRKKCFEKILEMKKNGLSILFVSHSNQSLESLCERGTLLHNGSQVFLGDIRTCVKRYMDLIGDENKKKGIEEMEGMPRSNVGVGNVQFSNILVYQEGKDKNNSDVEYGQNILIEFNYRFLKKTSNDYQLRLGFKTHEGQNIQKFYFHESPFLDGYVYQNEKIISLQKEGRCVARILNPKLFPQTLRLDISIKSMRMSVHEGGISNSAVFRIVEPKKEKMYFEYGFGSITEFDYEIQSLE